jgi:MraZ protein
LFLGKHACKLEQEYRLLLPSAFRGQLSGGIYVTQGFDRNLLVLPTAAFLEIYNRVRALNIADPLARLLQRMILGTAYELGTDQEGRIILPKDLIDFANLGEAVLAIGQGDYFEFWSTDLWNQQETQLADAEKNASRFSILHVATR